MPFLQTADGFVFQNQPNTFSVAVPVSGDRVKLSFFGGLAFGQINSPDCSADNKLKIASAEDLLALKLGVIHSRIEAKDYWDIWALLKSGFSLPVALGHLDALHPLTSNWQITLRTLIYFQGGDLDTLSADLRRDLEEAVTQVREVPEFSGPKHPIGWMP